MNLVNILEDIKKNIGLPSTLLIYTNDHTRAFNELNSFTIKDFGINLEEYNPNLFLIKPLQNGNINIDQIRKLKNFLHQTSTEQIKLVVIHEAEKMNIHCFNACLKLLEEPSSDSKIFLLTTSPGSIPLTVRSRCYKIDLMFLLENKNKSYIQMVSSILHGSISQVLENLDLNSQWSEFSSNCQTVLNKTIKYQLQSLKDTQYCSDEKLLFDKNKSPTEGLIDTFEEIKLLMNHVLKYELDRSSVALLVLGLIYEHFSN